MDLLQEKIRKLKNPSVLELALPMEMLPPHLLESCTPAEGYGRFCLELLEKLRDVVPAVRVSLASFVLLGAQGLEMLEKVLQAAAQWNYYVILDGPELLSPAAAAAWAPAMLGSEGRFPCNGALIGGYLGSDILKPFLAFCGGAGKDVFVAARTGNKSASQVQDLLTGGRLVHMAVADHVNRAGGDLLGKHGYSGRGILASASSGEGLRSLRGKYPKLFLLVDGYDYPGANAKNCSFAFDRLGHGAAVCSGTGITCAWEEEQSDGTDYLEHALGAALRMKKNLCRYVTVL